MNSKEPTSSTASSLIERVRTCNACGLCRTRRNAVPGEGPESSRIMFVGEAPGHVNDEIGRPFVGVGGKIFDKILTQAGLVRSEIYVTNVVKCWPPDNRKPKAEEISSCRPYLDEEISMTKPRIIFALGSVAFERLSGQKIKLREEHGKLFVKGQTPIIAVFHPNGLRYIKGGIRTLVTDIVAGLAAAGLSPLARELPPNELQLWK